MCLNIVRERIIVTIVLSSFSLAVSVKIVPFCYTGCHLPKLQTLDSSVSDPTVLAKGWTDQGCRVMKGVVCTVYSRAHSVELVAAWSI